MTRRQLLAGVGWCLAASAVQAKSDPRHDDLMLEEQISRAQRLALQAGTAYQDWLNGRIHSDPVRDAISKQLAGLQIFQKRATELAVPASRGAIVQWARLQKQEMQFFLGEIKKESNQRKSAAELQKRWQKAVELQTQLLEARRRQLLVLRKLPGRAEVSAYYQWKSLLLGVLQAELELARDVAVAFEERNQNSRMARKAIALHDRAEAIQGPAACALAQKLYLERFAKLGELCRTAQLAISSPDQDSVANLQENEADYREKAAASDDASLAALKGLLSGSR